MKCRQLTTRQRKLYSALPLPPSEGVLLRGADHLSAESMVSLGFARRVAESFGGAWYVRAPVREVVGK